jgi:hypothetical protein
MPRRVPFYLVFACLFLCSDQMALQAQEFKVLNRTVQVHGFASQGFVYTNDNNWLTMNTSQGSAAFTDFGLNMSAPITDKLRVGAQVYDRNLGQLGQYHPSLDWAVVDYRFKPWLGFRGGKVKTVLGLDSDTQDLDFLRTFALLPQSVYPTDIRDATISHVGGDVYGAVPLKHNLGDLAYTAYGGRRHDSNYSAYVYFLQKYGVSGSTYGGLQYGGDLRWNTPVKGLLLGASRMNEDLTDKGSVSVPGIGFLPYTAVSRADWTNQFYGEYTLGKLRIDSEHRRFVRNQVVNGGVSEIISDVRGWYLSASYRLTKRLALGSYYSRYTITSVAGGTLTSPFDQETNTSLPANHIYDKVITARVDLNRYWNLKVEGHFMNGYGNSSYPDGFYPQVNPLGFKPDTNALVLKTSVNF